LRLKNVDILRGIAAISVTYFHLSGSTDLTAKIANTGKWGYLGVDIFFVISGFILPYSLHQRRYQIRDFFKFIAKRFLRIGPAYLITIAISIALAISAGQSIPSWQTILAHLGYLNYILGYESLSPVFWTLAIEFQFYLLLGLSFQLISHRSNIWPMLLIGLMFALSFISSSHFIPSWFSLFAFGILIYRKVMLNTSTIIFWLANTVILIFAGFRNGIPEALTGLATSLSILYLNINSNTLVYKCLLWLGTVSYSLYLVHWHIGRVGVAVFRHIHLIGDFEYLRLLVGLIIALVSAWVLYLTIEKPSYHLSNQIKYNAD